MRHFIEILIDNPLNYKIDNYQYVWDNSLEE